MRSVILLEGSENRQKAMNRFDAVMDLGALNERIENRRPRSIRSPHADDIRKQYTVESDVHPKN